LGSNGVANPGYIAAFSVGAVLVFACLWFVWFVFWYMVRGVFFFCFEGSIFPYPSASCASSHQPWHDKAPLTCFEQPIDDQCSRGTVRRCRHYCDDECPSYLLGHVPPLSMRQAFVAHMTGVPQSEHDAMLDHGQPSSHGHELGHGHDNNRDVPEHEHDDGHDDDRLENSAHRSPRSNHTHRPLPVEDTALDLDRHQPVIPSVARVAVPPALPPPSTGTTSVAKPEGFLL
jgi:hypothetical protein